MIAVEIDIKGIEKAALLAALFNASKFIGPAPANLDAAYVMTTEQAAGLLRHRQTAHGWGGQFWQLIGRPMFTDIGGDVMVATTYDHYNGAGAAARVVAALRALPR